MEKQKLNQKMLKRSFILLLAFMIISLLIVFALFKIQIIDYELYQYEVINQLTVETNVNPLRGSIFDRNGTVIATNKTVWILYVCPKKIQSPEFIAHGLSEITGISYEIILEKAENKSYKYQIINNSLEKDITIAVREFIDQNNLEEQVVLNASTKRYYPFSSLASHTLGFVNADGIGIYGLEKTYNNILEGTTGKYITAQDAQSSDMPFQYETFIEDDNGYNLVTTIDVYMQNQLEEQLENAVIESGAQNRACGIIMNPQNGEIYAMAVYPSYNLNAPYTLDDYSQESLSELEQGSKEYREAYLNLLYTMWNNKAVTELYEPGSTFKIITTAIALEEHAATLNSHFNCTGSLKIDGYYRAISCHKRKGHGNLSFAEALQQSCNPAMMTIASRIGKERFYNYFTRFGFTSKTGIDVPSEVSGYYHSYSDFSNVSLAVYAFGQTFKTTAIQQISAISSVANGGKSITPHFIREIVDNENNLIYEWEEPEQEQIISEDVCETISNILEEGVSGEGGAKNAYVAGYRVAAKTGTSEKRDKYDENGNASYRVSSCVAYAPSENAQLAIIIMVDEPMIGSKYGSVVAAPYASNLLELVLPYMGIEPEYDEEDLEHIQIEIPNVTGSSLRDAANTLDSLGIMYEIIGNGENVNSQMPIAKSKIYKKSGKIILYTGNDTPNNVVIPNVVGLSPEEANQLLINSGLNIRINGAENFAYGDGAEVVAQFPSSGISVEVGTVVSIEILFTDESE